MSKPVQLYELYLYTPLPEKPTAQTIIKLCRQHAFNMGLIGMTNSLILLKEFAQQFRIDLNAKDSRRPKTVLKAMQEEVQRYEHEASLIQLLRDNKEATIEAETIIFKQLRAAGMSEEDFQNVCKRNDVLLWHKIAKLYELENPKKRNPSRVRVHLIKEIEGGTVREDVYLEILGTLEKAKKVLSSASWKWDLQGNRLSTGSGEWFYQLQPLHHCVVEGRIALQTEDDYRQLIKTVSKESLLVPTATLFQGSTFAFQDELARLAEEEDKDILDHKGNPFFKSVDFEALTSKGCNKPEMTLEEWDAFVERETVPLTGAKVTKAKTVKASRKTSPKKQKQQAPQRKSSRLSRDESELLNGL